MSTTAIENNPITINLPDAARSSGWTVDGTVATHESCNSGNLYLLGYDLTAGVAYEYSFEATMSSGYVEAFLGTAHGVQTSATGLVHETVTATGSQLYLFANGNCSITNFIIHAVEVVNDNKAKNTISFSEKTKKWVSFYSYIPEIAMSLFTKLYSGFEGDIYVHEIGSTDRNRFYGVQQQSIIQFVDNAMPAVPKTFMSLSLQCNELMITTTDGIQTSLGQISELASVDFIKDFLSDGVSQVNVSAIEGIYAANFLRDKNTGLLDGDPLKGNYLIVELISTSAAVLQLYTINIVATHSPVGSR